MIDTPLPLEIEGKPIKLPRQAARGKERPVWSEYKPKTPVDCNHCELVAYETAMAGEPYQGMRTAPKRRQDGQNLLLCHEHARVLHEQDQVDFPPGESASKSTGRGQRFIA